jgi:hypothetical protein
MQYMSLRPVVARSDQFFGRLIVAGDKNDRSINDSQDIEADTEIAPNIAEVTRPDEDVMRWCQLDQSARGSSICVEIAEEEEVHELIALRVGLSGTLTAVCLITSETPTQANNVNDLRPAPPT